MKLTIQREALLKPLQVVTGVVERRQTLPILSNVLLSASGEVLSITGTDLEVEMVARVGVEKLDDGEITFPARKFLDICRTLPEGAQLDIAVEGGRAVIKSGRSRFVLATLPATEFPSIEALASPVALRLPRGDLRGVIEQTYFAMAQQDVRYYLNGLLLELAPEHVRAVATDGHRLALSDAPGDLGLTEQRQIIVPRKGVLELLRLLDDSEALLDVELSANHIRVVVDDITFTSKLVDGRFPDYNRVVPQQGGTVFACDRETLREGFARASILSNEKYRGIRLQLEPGRLRALVHNPEQEEAEEEIAVEYDGVAFEVGFNVQYLLDALGAIKTAEVRMMMSDANSSCLLQGVGDERSKYVIMPMRL